MSMMPHIVSPFDDPAFPDYLQPDETGLIAVGGDLSDSLLLEAYRKGIFPWFVGPPVMWYSPDPRLVLYPPDMHVSRRLRRTLNQGRFTVRFDTDFDRVIRHCAGMPRPNQNGTWIDDHIIEAYSRLHRRRIAHCVAVYQDGELCGGLYGLCLGRLFFGESMFSLKPGASKIGLYYLAQWTARRRFLLIDCQVRTEHLQRMGAVEVSRSRYLELLKEGLAYPDGRHRWQLD